MADEKKLLSRRRALKILGMGVGATGAVAIYRNPTFAQHEHMKAGAKVHAEAAAAPKPVFFSPAEMATIAVMSQLIIPSDDHSPGAKEAGVPAFIDLMVGAGAPEVRALWRDGLAAVDATCAQRHQKRFVEVDEPAQIVLLGELAKNEREPKTLEERFFKALKSMTIDGYYTSEIGIHDDLQYKGNGFTPTFVGCTHPEHKA